MAETAALGLSDWHPLGLPRGEPILPFNWLVEDKGKAGKELKQQPRAGSQGHMHGRWRAVVGTITPQRPILWLGVMGGW